MGGMVSAFLWGFLTLLPAYGGGERGPLPADRLIIVTFDAALDPDVKARELCLLHGCEIQQVYRALPGMAIRKGNLAAIARAGGVTGLERDLAVVLQQDTVNLIGAPGHAPLAVLGGKLDANRLSVEHAWRYSPPAAADDMHGRTTGLLESLAQRQPERRFWSFEILDHHGRGRLSDLLAALDQLAGLRFAVGAVFIPLQVEGHPPLLLCQIIDKVLRRGLLVITDVDGACSPLEIQAR